MHAQSRSPASCSCLPSLLRPKDAVIVHLACSVSSHMLYILRAYPVAVRQVLPDWHGLAIWWRGHTIPLVPIPEYWVPSKHQKLGYFGRRQNSTIHWIHVSCPVIATLLESLQLMTHTIQSSIPSLGAFGFVFNCIHLLCACAWKSGQFCGSWCVFPLYGLQGSNIGHAGWFYPLCYLAGPS